MITTSVAYNPYTVVRDIDMAVTYPVVSETAASHATYVVPSKWEFSDLSQLNNLNYVDTKYATCEPGLTMLDGSFRFLPDVLSTEQIGWWGYYLSKSDGSFEIPFGEQQKFVATLSQKETVVGFSLYFSKTNPVRECTVTVWDGDTELFEEVFISDNEEMIIELPVSDFDKVEITNFKTKEPYRRIKMLSFSFGITKRWNRNHIVSASIEESADVTGNTLPINTLKVEFDNSTHEFDLFGATRQYVYRTATNTASVSAQNAHTLAKISQIRNIDAEAYKYATCEDGLVMLSKGYKYIPDTVTDAYQVGFVNNAISTAQGTFSEMPSVSYNWDKEINISGFRIFFFENNYADTFAITAYNDNSVIETKTISQNTDSVVDVDFSVSSCDKVTFSFASVAEQNRFVKVCKIQVMRYVDSWGSYLTKRQKILAEFVVNGEHINAGNAYLFDSLKQINGGLTAEITAKSDVAYLNDQKHDGEHGTTTLGTAMSNVLSGTNITVSYSPSSLSSTTVSKATPKNTTKRAATHYFAQAAKATCFFDREGVLNIKALEAGDYVDDIDITNIYSSDIARMNEYVNMIRLTVKDEYTNPETSNTYYGGSGLYYRELQNNCVYTGNGTNVAQWLLKQYDRRVYFEIQHRGNPALELGDTIRITTADGTRYLAVIYNQLFEYGFGGGLKCTIEAIEASKN